MGAAKTESCMSKNIKHCFCGDASKATYYCDMSMGALAWAARIWGSLLFSPRIAASKAARILGGPTP